MIMGAYYVGKYTICYLGSIMIIRSYCVGKVQYATSVVLYDNGVVI